MCGAGSVSDDDVCEGGGWACGGAVRGLRGEVCVVSEMRGRLGCVLAGMMIACVYVWG